MFLECFKLKKLSIFSKIIQFHSMIKRMEVYKGVHIHDTCWLKYMYMYICTYYIAVIIVLLVIKLILWYNEMSSDSLTRREQSWRFVAIVDTSRRCFRYSCSSRCSLLFCRVVGSLGRVDRRMSFFRDTYSLSATYVLLRFWKKPLIIQPAKTWIKLAKGIDLAGDISLVRELNITIIIEPKTSQGSICRDLYS